MLIEQSGQFRAFSALQSNRRFGRVIFTAFGVAIRCNPLPVRGSMPTWKRSFDHHGRACASDREPAKIKQKGLQGVASFIAFSKKIVKETLQTIDRSCERQLCYLLRGDRRIIFAGACVVADNTWSVEAARTLSADGTERLCSGTLPEHAKLLPTRFPSA